MPFIGLGLHVLIALYFGIHAIRRGHNMYWLIILFSFPLLGSIVYFFVAYLPEIRQSRGLRVAKNTLVNMVDPSRELREARNAFDMTPTVANRMRLATALLNAGSPQEAREHYQQAAQGPFENDPELLAGLAHAQMATGASEAAMRTLEKLFGAHPQRRSQSALALLYAQSLAGCGSLDTRAAFEEAMGVANGPDTKCLYAEWLASRNTAEDREKAHALYEEIIRDSKHWTSHARSMNREWARRAQEGLASL